LPSFHRFPGHDSAHPPENNWQVVAKWTRQAAQDRGAFSHWGTLAPAGFRGNDGSDRAAARQGTGPYSRAVASSAEPLGQTFGGAGGVGRTNGCALLRGVTKRAEFQTRILRERQGTRQSRQALGIFFSNGCRSRHPSWSIWCAVIQTGAEAASVVLPMKTEASRTRRFHLRKTASRAFGNASNMPGTHLVEFRILASKNPIPIGPEQAAIRVRILALKRLALGLPHPGNGRTRLPCTAYT